MTGNREVADLVLLAPGATLLGTDTTTATYSAGGQRAFTNTTTRDGIENRDPQFGYVRLLIETGIRVRGEGPT